MDVEPVAYDGDPLEDLILPDISNDDTNRDNLTNGKLLLFEDNNDDDFFLTDKENQTDGLFAGSLDGLDFSDLLMNEDFGSNNESIFDTNFDMHTILSNTINPKSTVEKKKEETDIAHIPEKRSLSTIHEKKERIVLKRTKSNPFYSPSRQIRNLVLKNKNRKQFLQQKASLPELPLGEQNINVKRESSTKFHIKERHD